MGFELKLSVIFLLSLLVSACVSAPLKAPCDEHASYCGTKTKINHW